MFIVNTVHDSVIMELPKDETEAFVELGRECFGPRVFHYLKEIYDIDWNVPMGMGLSASRNWGKGSNHVWDLEGYEAPDGDVTEEYSEDFENEAVQ